MGRYFDYNTPARLPSASHTLVPRARAPMASECMLLGPPDCRPSRLRIRGKLVVQCNKINLTEFAKASQLGLDDNCIVCVGVRDREYLRVQKLEDINVLRRQRDE
jgi:hypothetical protein